MQPALGGQPAPSPASAVAAGQQNAFSIGRVISRTFSTWWSHAVVFSILTLISSAPIWLAMFLGDFPIAGVNSPSPLDPAAVAAAPPVQPTAGFWLAYAGTMLLFLVEVGAITYGVIQHLAGKRVSLGAMIAAGARRAVPVLVVGLLAYVIVVVGMILLLVPGIYFACALAVAIPAAVVERPGVFGAIKRSFALTKGKRFAVFVVFLVMFVVMMGVMAFTLLLPQLTQSVSPLAGFVAGQIVNVVIGTLFWVAPGVVYHDLRVAKEGVATAQLAAVFE
jgi:hypothetical protein